MKYFKARVMIACGVMLIGAIRLVMALFDDRPTPWPTLAIATAYLIIGVANLVLLRLKQKKVLSWPKG